MYPRESISAGPIILRPLTEADIPAVARACSDPVTQRFIPAMPSPYTEEDARFWVTRIAEPRWGAGGAEFVIADARTGELDGAIGLHPPDRFDNVEAGYWVAPWARRKGVASAALRAVTTLAFEHGAPRVHLVAEMENVGSQKVALAAGFRHEGLLRGAGPVRGGGRADMAQYGRLPGDSGEPGTPFLPFLPEGGLTDGVVRLTMLTADDASAYHAVGSLPDVVKYSVPPEPRPFEEILYRCTGAGYRWLNGIQAEMAIRDAATGAFAGEIQLSHLTPPMREAMVGYSLHSDFRGRGLVTRAVELLAEWAFTQAGLRRLISGTDPGNLASQAVLERAGFTRGQTQKEYLPGPNGTWTDNVEWLRLR
ncbi:GNAT family N-acetyltransferase [Herbidospora galbida]|uniref:GNAT family N-acetyltransferase n=1 Tax=Herbidospora galbida TaxID=2575442 RepID=A0A4U3LRK3_9ACTN|nr:GNAT family N-acetyltransferase [Herbidospora galbida]TKK77077.1 GNAT family N-acetyltransferase [Herbidospora galbida]